ncbi:MAG TPA: YihY/virulence factor BrkB family protein [Burkholderiaceae bacterium]|nr:YihY/virulence factor BrkB family protein [Burkholderiaceae bacterium]
MHAATDDAHRGRQADRPTHIPAKGWKDIALRVKDQLDENHLSIIAAGVAFYLLLSFVPALAALVAIYGVFADPAQIGERVASMGSVLPKEALEMIEEQLQRLASTSAQTLGLSAVVGVLLSLWSATKGTKSIIEAINVAYDEHEKRGFVRLNLIAIGLTLALLAFVIVSLALVAIVPLVLKYLGLGDGVETALSLLRWPLLLVFLMAALAVLYRYAPARDEAKWQWVSPGAIAAAVLWVIASAGFSIYVSRSDSYSATYGSLGAVAIMMMWLLIGAYAVLLGAQFNAETERQTKQDTTEGPDQPLGARGAYAADTVGPSAGERAAGAKTTGKRG